MWLARWEYEASAVEKSTRYQWRQVVSASVKSQFASGILFKLAQACTRQKRQKDTRKKSQGF
jgi:hypothetical protein